MRSVPTGSDETVLIVVTGPANEICRIVVTQRWLEALGLLDCRGAAADRFVSESAWLFTMGDSRPKAAALCVVGNYVDVSVVFEKGLDRDDHLIESLGRIQCICHHLFSRAGIAGFFDGQFRVSVA